MAIMKEKNNRNKLHDKGKKSIRFDDWLLIQDMVEIESKMNT